MMHKSQRLTLEKAKIDLENKEFATSLSFVAVSRVYALEDILFQPFSFKRFQYIKKYKRIQERKVKEEQLFLLFCNSINK